MSGYWMWWRVWTIVLLGNVCLASVEEDLDTSNGFYEEPSLICGDDLMSYSLPTMAHFNTSFRLSVQGAKGALTSLVTDGSCGIWVIPEDDSVDVYVQYDSCYTENKDGYHTMTIFLELNTTGEWEVYQEEVLRCPIFVMDAPTISECSRISTGSRLPCGSPSDSQEVCLQNGCCYDQMNSRTPCYYGNKVTAQCTKDSQLTVAISKDATVPSLILASVKVLRGSGPECNPVDQSDAFLLFSFPLSSCGTKHTADGTSVIYENDLVADQDVRTWSSSSITRDSTFRLHIRCHFAASGSVPLNVEVFTLPPPPPASSDGLLTLEMRIAQDSLYTQYYAAQDYPIVKVLRDPVFVEVRILNRNDPNLVLMLKQCWATPTASPFQEPQWPILVDGCPFEGDNYNTQLVEVDSAVQYALHYKHFIVKTFTFVDVMPQMAFNGLVYFHCSASVCVPSTEDPCRTRCPGIRHKHFLLQCGSSLSQECIPVERRALDNFELETLVSAEGPIEFYTNEKENLMEGMNHSGHLSKMVWILAVVPGSIFGILLLIILLKKQKKYKIKNLVL